MSIEEQMEELREAWATFADAWASSLSVLLDKIKPISQIKIQE